MLQPAPAFVRTLAVRTPVQHPVATTFGTAGVMHLLEPSYSNANDCDFGAIASFSPLPLDVHMHMHTLRMSLPDVAHSVGIKHEDSGGPGKTAQHHRFQEEQN